MIIITPSPPPSPFVGTSLFFPGGAEQCGVLCGDFFPAPLTGSDPTIDLGACFWEVWLEPGEAGSTIIVVDGFGGAHAILFQFVQAGAGSLNRLSGNMNFALGTASWSSFDGLMPTEPGHVALLYIPTTAAGDPGHVYGYVNGICSMKVPTTTDLTETGATLGARRSTTKIAGGAGNLGIGSLGHSSYRGKMQQVRGWDGTAAGSPSTNMPRTGVTIAGGHTEWGRAFVTESILSGQVPNPNTGAGTYTSPQFCMNLTTPRSSPVDLGAGLPAGTLHHGTLANMREASGIILGSGPNSYPRPTYVVESRLPSGLVTAARAHPRINPSSNLAVLGGNPRVFESWGGGWETYAWDNRTPGVNRSVQFSTIGAGPWVGEHGSPTGIPAADWGQDNSNGTVALSPSVSHRTVIMNTADYFIAVERNGAVASGGSGLNGEVGIVFRMQDRLNYYYLQAIDNDIFLGGKRLWMFRVDAGSDTVNLLQILTPNDTWLSLGVEVSSTTFRAYVNSTATPAGPGPGNGWVQVGVDQTGQTTYQTATRVGVYSGSVSGNNLITSRRRMKRFTVW